MPSVKLPVLCPERFPLESPTFRNESICLFIEQCVTVTLSLFWGSEFKVFIGLWSQMHMRSHNKWNFQTFRRKAGVQCSRQAKQPYQCINISKADFSRHQPRANLTSRPSVNNCFSLALSFLYGYSFWVQNLRKWHSEVQKLIPQNWKCSIFSYKVFSELNPL